MGSEFKPPHESDTDSMAEYADDGIDKLVNSNLLLLNIQIMEL